LCCCIVQGGVGSDDGELEFEKSNGFASQRMMDDWILQGEARAQQQHLFQ
jgi:hypothetical protein